MMIWAFKKTGGGPIFSQKGALHGSDRSWAWLRYVGSQLSVESCRPVLMLNWFCSCMNAVIGNYATLAVSTLISLLNLNVLINVIHRLSKDFKYSIKPYYIYR